MDPIPILPIVPKRELISILGPAELHRLLTAHYLDNYSLPGASLNRQTPEDLELLADSIYSYLLTSATEFSVFYDTTSKQLHVPRDREQVIEDRRLQYDCRLDNGRHDNPPILSTIKLKLTAPKGSDTIHWYTRPPTTYEPPALSLTTLRLNVSNMLRSVPINLRINASDLRQALPLNLGAKAKAKAIYGPNATLAMSLPVKKFKLSSKAATVIRSLHLDSIVKLQSRHGPMGLLSKLPHHILEEILDDYVDIESLTTLRRTNKAVRKCVTTLSKYSTLMKHAPGVIRAGLAIKVASSFTPRGLWLALRSKKCAYCPEFGAFIYLLTATRVCLKCNMESPHCLPMDLAAVEKYYRLDKAALVQGGVAIASPLPGIYHTLNDDVLDVTGLVDRTLAAELAAKMFSVTGDCSEISEMIHTQMVDTWMVQMDVWENTPPASRGLAPVMPEFNDMSFHADGMYSNPYRLKCTTALPWLDCRDHDSYIREKGVMCRHCYKIGLIGYYRGDGGSNLKIPRTAYSYRDFLNHFLHCKENIEEFLEKTKNFRAMRLIPYTRATPPENRNELVKFDVRRNRDT